MLKLIFDILHYKITLFQKFKLKAIKCLTIEKNSLFFFYLKPSLA